MLIFSPERNVTEIDKSLGAGQKRWASIDIMMKKKLMYVTSSGLKKLVKFNFREHFFGLPLPGILKIYVYQIKYIKYSRNNDVRDVFRRRP